MSFISFSICSYNTSLFSPYHCKIYSKASSTTTMIILTPFYMSVAFILGLLAHIFFLIEGFSGEAFFFCEVSVPTRGSWCDVASPYSYISPSSPPPSPLPWSYPPPFGEPDPSSSEALSSSSISICCTSTFFFIFFALFCLTCSTRVTKGLPLMSTLESYVDIPHVKSSFYSMYLLVVFLTLISSYWASLPSFLWSKFL